MRQHPNIDYILHLADNNLIMCQRLSAWTGHGPVLEHDIALTNIGLDMLGQARNFYQYAGALINEHRLLKDYVPERTYPVDEDDLAYHRLEHQFRNHLLTELPNGDWGQTMLKVYFFAQYQQGIYQWLQQGNDTQLAAIAEKSLKEVRYHVKWSRDWVLRLGDGTEESHARMQDALDYLWPFTGELFEPGPWHTVAPMPQELEPAWRAAIEGVLLESTLKIPAEAAYQKGGLLGRHTEHLGYILAEMQYLQRVYPGNEW